VDQPRGATGQADFAVRALAAFQAILDEDDGRLRRILAEWTLDLADGRCDGCGEPFRSEAELHDAVAARGNEQLGFCTACLRRERWA
jgi:hypothetical protein